MTVGPQADGTETDPDDSRPRLRSIVGSVYAPALLYSIGQGAVAPVVVLSALQLGASTPQAFVAASLAGLGLVLANLPAGQLVARIGDRSAMHLSVGFLAVALLGCVLAPSRWVLGMAVALTGAASSVWGLARQLFMTEAIPYELRGRAMATLGGVNRIGVFLGPFLAAGVMHQLGVDGAYWLHIAAAGAASIVLLATRDPDPPASGARPDVSLRATIRVVHEHWPLLRTLGLGSLLINAVRAARVAVIPVWATHMGLDAPTASLVFGLSGAADMLLFYPAGIAMDRYGRRVVSTVAMIILGGAMLALPMATDLASLIVVAVLMGVGNGLSTGMVLVLSSDAAPVEQRGQFLGAFRLWADSGTLLGPLLISGVAAATSITPAIMMMGLVGMLAAASMLRWVPRTRVRTVVQ